MDSEEMPQSTNPGTGKNCLESVKRCVRDCGDRVRLSLSSYLVFTFCRGGHHHDVVDNDVLEVWIRKKELF